MVSCYAFVFHLRLFFSVLGLNRLLIYFVSVCTVQTQKHFRHMHSEHLRNSDWQREIQYILRSIKSNQITSESKYRLHSVSFMYVVFFCCCSVSHEYPQNRKTKCKRARACTKQSVAIHWCACAVCFSLHQILLALFLSLNFSSVPLFVMKAILFFYARDPRSIDSATILSMSSKSKSNKTKPENCVFRLLYFFTNYRFCGLLLL